MILVLTTICLLLRKWRGRRTNYQRWKKWIKLYLFCTTVFQNETKQKSASSYLGPFFTTFQGEMVSTRWEATHMVPICDSACSIRCRNNFVFRKRKAIDL